MASPSKRVSVALIAAGLLMLSFSAGLAIAANGSVSIVESNGKYAYSPPNLTVEQGTKVKWTNNSDAPHTVTADDSSFESITFSENEAFEQTFNTIGEFGYHCELHEYMHAKVTVVAATSSQPPTDAVPDAGATGGSALPWLSIFAAGAAAIVFALLGQRALVARKRSQ